MKIAMISDHGCIRVHKMSIPLLMMGHQVYLVARKENTYTDSYKAFFHIKHKYQLMEVIKILDKEVDLFHVHNEPSWFVTVINEISDKPVVLDIHDTFLGRTKPDSEFKRFYKEEEINFKLADALVFVSSQYKNIVLNEYNIDKPYTILPSYASQMMQVYHAKEWAGGLVYEGKITLPSELSKLENPEAYRYSDYLKCAEQCEELGIDFHLYGRNDKAFMDTYGELAYCWGGLIYPNLLEGVSRHDWGLVGNVFEHEHYKTTLPNKLFDYIAAQVPPVVINAESSSNMISNYGIGITVNNLSELCERWREHRECRKNLIKQRREFMMETHIDKLLTLYKEIL